MSKKSQTSPRRRRLAVVAALTCLSATPMVAQACSADSPYLGSICIMAWPRSATFGGNTYMAAAGQQLPLSQYQALYAVIGTTYGGNGSTNFNLPDLRGRTIIGGGPTPINGVIYNYGVAGGSATVTLSQANLPAHVHGITTGGSGLAVSTGVGTLAVSTTLTGLSATTSMSGVTGSISGSSLRLRGTNTGNPQSAAQNNTLGTPTGTTKIYSDAAPNVDMNASSIAGTANVTFTGNPTTTVTGTPTSTIAGAPAVSISGNTGAVGASTAFSIMQPYLPMSYYIAITGIFPVQD